jgi:hypothetical protein
MDAGLIGGLIGMGVMVCVVCTGVLYEKGSEFVTRLKKKYQSYKQQRQPLLVVTSPILLRSGLQQWKMRELLVLK